MHNAAHYKYMMAHSQVNVCSSIFFADHAQMLVAIAVLDRVVFCCDYYYLRLILDVMNIS